MGSLKDSIRATYLRGSQLSPQEYIELLGPANETLESETECRPPDPEGLAGGLIELDADLPTLLLPDIHARVDLLVNALLAPEWNALERLEAGELQMVCVGDGFHAEARAIQRWGQAYKEYRTGFRHHKAMDEEMTESLSAMEIVMKLKTALGCRFHFLKGNHENIANEYGEGNYPFMKFVEEGAMVATYVRKFLGDDFLESYYRLEKNFPLMAVGGDFLVSHGEPVRFFEREEIIEYRRRGEVVLGFTWTDNDEADEDSVPRMLTHYLPEEVHDHAYHFGGHRPVPGLYRTRAGGRYVQFHNPDRFILVDLRPDRAIDLDRDIVEIPRRTAELVGA